MKYLAKFEFFLRPLFFLAAMSYAVVGLTGTDMLGAVFSDGDVMDVVYVLVILTGFTWMHDMMTRRPPTTS